MLRSWSRLLAFKQFAHLESGCLESGCRTRRSSREQPSRFCVRNRAQEIVNGSELSIVHVPEDWPRHHLQDVKWRVNIVPRPHHVEELFKRMPAVRQARGQSRRQVGCYELAIG